MPQSLIIIVTIYWVFLRTRHGATNIFSSVKSSQQICKAVITRPDLRTRNLELGGLATSSRSHTPMRRSRTALTLGLRAWRFYPWLPPEWFSGALDTLSCLSWLSLINKHCALETKAYKVKKMKVLCLQWLVMVICMDTKLSPVLQARSLEYVYRACSKAGWKLMEQNQDLVMSRYI